MLYIQQKFNNFIPGLQTNDESNKLGDSSSPNWMNSNTKNVTTVANFYGHCETESLVKNPAFHNLLKFSVKTK